MRRRPGNRTRFVVRGALCATLFGPACSAVEDPVRETTAAGAGGTTAGSGGTAPAGSGGSHELAGNAGSLAVSGQGGAAGAGGSAGGSGGVAGDAGGAGGQADAGAGGGVTDPGTEGDGSREVGPDYPKDPDLTDRGAPRGRTFRFTMRSEDSAIFRGEDETLDAANRHPFTRGITVYVPAAYEDGTPAPLLVIHDGPGPLELVSRALDNLTVEDDPARRLPAFITVAVANGGGDGKGSERGLEYDTLSDRLARFIEQEVLPAVLANSEILAAYPGIAFTDDPEGRAVMGCSSGGAAALTMGWFRPDLFRRIITYSGTFVDQQDDDAPEEATYPLGAWEYHSGQKLIESSAKKPLRVFLHASDRDLGWDAPESGHHNWVMANERTAAALEARGYHYRHLRAVDAGHCSGKVYDLTLADTLLWTWRGYPN